MTDYEYIKENDIEGLINKYNPLLQNTTHKHISNYTGDDYCINREDVYQDMVEIFLEAIYYFNTSKMKDENRYSVVSVFQQKYLNYKKMYMYKKIRYNVQIDNYEDIQYPINYTTHESVYEDILNEFCKVLNDREKTVFSYYMEGHNNTEIAKVMGFTSQYIHNIKKNIQKKYREFIN